jgi:hypothetical protein
VLSMRRMKKIIQDDCHFSCCSMKKYNSVSRVCVDFTDHDLMGFLDALMN